MKNIVNPLKNREKFFIITDVDFMKPGLRVYILALAGKKVVNYLNFIPSLHQSVRQMRADKARSAGNNNFVFFVHKNKTTPEAERFY